jgi:hypothetical protein
VGLAVGVDYGTTQSLSNLSDVPQGGLDKPWSVLSPSHVQCGPAEVQPLVLSPKVWMCMPRWALASWPLMSQVTVVGADSESCSKVMVPVTLESPRTTATACKRVSTDSGRSSRPHCARPMMQGSDIQQSSWPVDRLSRH